MLEARSPLHDPTSIVRDGVTLSEAGDFTLTQIAGEDATLKKAFGKLPATVGRSMDRDDRVALRIGPKQLWLLGDAPQAAPGVYLTPLSSGRARFLLEGARARHVLAALAAIDFHATKFKSDDFAMTGVHHIPVLIHCVGEQAFHVYVLRTFAQDMWEWIADAMSA